MKSKILVLSLFTLIITFVLSSCLTCETKEYKFAFTGKNKGTLTVKYKNIFSKYDSEELTQQEELDKDYAEMIDEYLNGEKLLESFPDATVKSKRLYEEGGKLCGEVIYEFSTLDHIKLFQANSKSPYMYMMSSFSFEEVISTNGTKGPSHFSIVYWDNKMKSLDMTTQVDTPDENSTSLLATWKKGKR